MNTLTESNNFIVYNEYEGVFLKNKLTGQEVQIGDFYGDPQGAIISADEQYCLMFGCGVIIYYLKLPFEPFQYHTKSAQWEVWGREGNSEDVWVENVEIDTQGQICITTDSGDIIKIKKFLQGL